MPRMGLINRILGKDKEPPSASRPAEADDPTAVDQAPARNVRRRDLVRIALRETMRHHGIPSDWIDCRTLSVLTRQHKSGMHVQFLVRKSDQQLLPFVHAFQEGFWREILRTDPRAKDWLFSVGWEFYGQSVAQGFSPMPAPNSWKDTGASEPAPVDSMLAMDAMDTQPPEEDEDDIASDLEALQSALSAPAELTADLPEAPPRKHRPG